MTDRSVNGKGSGARCGSRALLLLATPINGTILQTLADGPRPLVELRRQCDLPAQTTLRARLKELERAGAIAKRRRNRFPGMIECELTAAGRDLLFVVETIERWLRTSPDEPLSFGSKPAKAALRALVDGWDSTMLRLLASRPLSLTELDGIIESLSYPTLQRRLAAMRLAELVKPCPEQGNGTNPYRVTKWLRLGIGPLTAASHWERRHIPDETAPVMPLDAETGFLLALPALRLPEELSGTCRLGVEITRGKERRLAGTIAHVEDGRVATCTVRVKQSADAWAIGSVGAWLHAVIGADLDGLEVGGRQQLARSLIDGLHGALFGARAASLA